MINRGRWQKHLAAGLLAILAVVVISTLKGHPGPSTALRITPTEHPPAPDFSLPDLSGHQLALSGYRGKVVLLDFWATWCVPCRQEVPRFVELQSKYRGQGLEIIGVSMDDESEPVRDFYQQFRVNYPVVMGNAKTGELYGGVLGLPIAFVIGRDGRIYAKHIGATDMAVFEKEIAGLL